MNQDLVNCHRASRTRPVSLNILSLVVDDAGIERSGNAKRDNCGKIIERFFHHDAVANFDYIDVVKTSSSILF